MFVVLFSWRLCNRSALLVAGCHGVLRPYARTDLQLTDTDVTGETDTGGLMSDDTDETRLTDDTHGLLKLPDPV